MFKNQYLLVQSLEAGLVPPSSGSGCSHIPGTGICINEINYGRPFVHPPSTPYPSMAAETKKQDLGY